jgi:hypothetical protein
MGLPYDVLFLCSENLSYTRKIVKTAAMLWLYIILINCSFHSLVTVELYKYENLIDSSISWDGTPFVKQELYNTIDTLKDVVVTVKQSTVCDCKTIQAKIIDPKTMLVENLSTGTYFYADKSSIEYKDRRPNNGGMILSFDFGDIKTNYDGTLSYLMKGITWLPSYDLFITNSESEFYVNSIDTTFSSYVSL